MKKITFRHTDSEAIESGEAATLTATGETLLAALGALDAELHAIFGVTLADDGAFEIADALEALANGRTYERREFSEPEANFDLTAEDMTNAAKTPARPPRDEEADELEQKSFAPSVRVIVELYSRSNEHLGRAFGRYLYALQAWEVDGFASAPRVSRWWAIPADEGTAVP